MEFETFLDRALDVPFVVGGRDYDGWDCWGLVYCFFRDVRSDPIKTLKLEYDEKTTHLELSDLIDRQIPEWVSISARPEFGDIGLYRIGRFNSHVSLVLPNARMLHCYGNIGTHVDRIDALMWAGRNVGYFRRSHDQVAVQGGA